MNGLLLIINGMLVTVVLLMAVKLHYMHAAVREIIEGFREITAADTNTRIDISSRDRYMRRLAVEINERLKLVRDLRLRYENGDRELKDAVTNIAHDLRTPLTAMCGYVELLEREEKSAAAERYVLQIKNRTEAMKQLTEEMFRYSVVMSDRELKPEKLDLVQLLEENLLSFYAVMNRRGIEPELCLPDGQVIREADRAALNRIFSNIIGNAVRYTDGDLSVTMSTDGAICFSNSAKELDPLAAERLFDRFYTVNAARNSTGLGLSIARQLTERLGGQIRAEYKHARLYISLKL